MPTRVIVKRVNLHSGYATRESTASSLQGLEGDCRMTMRQSTPSRATCVVRDTAAANRPHALSVAPGRTAARYLHYGRIALTPGTSRRRGGPRRVRNRPRYASRATRRSRVAGFDLLAMRALRRVSTSPRAPAFVVTAGAAPDATSPRLPRRSSDLTQSSSCRSPRSSRIPGCTSKPAATASRRTLNILLGKNVVAGRLMAGVTFSQPGNWTSWPPHEHAVLAEEAYLFIDMPRPAFGVQLVYVDDVESGTGDDRPRRRRRADAAGLSSQRRGAGTSASTSSG